MRGECIIPNCNRPSSPFKAFCSLHRDRPAQGLAKEVGLVEMDYAAIEGRVVSKFIEQHEALLFLFAIAAECARNRELSLILLEDQVRDIIASAKAPQ